MKSIKSMYVLLIVIGLGYTSISFGEGEKRIVPEGEKRRIFDSRETMDLLHQGDKSELIRRQGIELQHINPQKQQKKQQGNQRAIPEGTFTEETKEMLKTKGLDLSTVTEEDLQEVHKEVNQNVDKKHEQERQTFDSREKNRSGSEIFRANSQVLATRLMDKPEDVTSKSFKKNLDTLKKELKGAWFKETRVKDIIRVLNEQPDSPVAKAIKDTINSMNMNVGVHFNTKTGEYDLITSMVNYNAAMNEINVMAQNYIGKVKRAAGRDQYNERYGLPETNELLKLGIHYVPDEQNLKKLTEERREELLEKNASVFSEFVQPVS